MTDTIGQSDDFLTPVGRETLQDRVYDQLRRTLINGGFAAARIIATMVTVCADKMDKGRVAR